MTIGTASSFGLDSQATEPTPIASVTYPLGWVVVPSLVPQSPLCLSLSNYTRLIIVGRGGGQPRPLIPASH